MALPFVSPTKAASMDSLIRRHLLKPLAKRKVSPAAQSVLDEALRKLASFALASDITPLAAERLKQMKEAKGKGAWKDAEYAAAFVDLSTALLHARKMSRQDYVFAASYAALGVHEERLFKRVYPEIETISAMLRVIEQAHGADDGWAIGDGPDEHQRLSAEWELLADKRFILTMKEIGADDIASLYQDKPNEYERLRERGRRFIFQKDEVVAAISDAVVRYEREARSSASVGAYTASVILLGAAVEGILLLRCLRSKRKAVSVASKLPKKFRPSTLDDFLRWNFDNLIEVCLAAGWLPLVPELEVRPDGLAHLLRRMRNYVHPGRVAKDRPWIEIEKEDYEQAEVIYTTIFAATFRR
jgi:hypothetical protein